jgi:8-amino-7-oxononanoate synthase
MASFDHLAARLAELDQQRRLRRLLPRTAEGVHVIDPAGRRLLNFGGNDYLGLAIERRAALDVSSGSMASPLVCGWTEQHERLAEMIADFEATESAVLFPSGYAACSGTIATLADQGDLILSDELNHASLIDGCRLSRAARIVYPHRNYETVQSVLDQRRGDFARVWIVTDAVFSMDGHIAPLTELCDLAEQFDAHVLVDEAHGTGVLGETGRGACEALGVTDRVAVRIGTLSKAIGGQGGFVAGPKVVIDYLINACRSLIFSTSLAPSAVAAAVHGFEAINRQPDRRARVGQLARRLRESLSIDADPIESSVPIISWVVGADERAVAASEQLAESRFYVPAIRPPSVKEGTARLRISLSAAHDEEMVDSLAKAIAELERSPKESVQLR